MSSSKRLSGDSLGHNLVVAALLTSCAAPCSAQSRATWRRLADIRGCARQIVREFWVPECQGFRRFPCPTFLDATFNNDMTVEPLLFASLNGGDPQFGQIAMRAMRSAFAGGIGSIAHLRWTPHIIYNMDRLEREKK
jgi:hypothetical protein